jgi:hypothetical protein
LRKTVTLRHQTRDMTATELRRKSSANKKRLDTEYEAAEKRQREREEQERLTGIEYETKSLKKEIKEKIEEAVESGKFSASVNSGYYRSYLASYEAVAEYYRKKGFTAKVDRNWYEADSGDKDSGEGAHDSGCTHTLTISWEKE